MHHLWIHGTLSDDQLFWMPKDPLRLSKILRKCDDISDASTSWALLSSGPESPNCRRIAGEAHDKMYSVKTWDRVGVLKSVFGKRDRVLLGFGIGNKVWLWVSAC